MNKPKNQSVTNISGAATQELDGLLDSVLDYFYIHCPNEECKDDEDAFLVAFNNQIECNMCDEYSSEVFTISLEFD